MSYTDFIWENFGPLEWLLSIELIVLAAAWFFYQVAKFIAKQDRHDPLVRFYRTFWVAFRMPVTPFKELELANAEEAARSAGMRLAGDIDDRQLKSMDAVDLHSVAEADQMPGIAAPEYVPDDEEDSTPTPALAPAGKGGTAAPAKPTTAIFDARIIASSAADRLVGFQNGEVVVEVIHDAEDGQANGTIINFVSAKTGIPAYRIALLRGHYKVRKTFQVENIDQNSLNQRLAHL
jgi:uncharacterized protein YggU (UPF0235/DUF167 family)